MFNQSCVKVSTNLSDVGGLAVKAFDLINCSLSVIGFLPIIDVGQLMPQHSYRFVI